MKDVQSTNTYLSYENGVQKLSYSCKYVLFFVGTSIKTHGSATKFCSVKVFIKNILSSFLLFQVEVEDSNFCIVVGNEHKGVSKEVIQHCDEVVCIPQKFGTSLSVSHATAILIYELVCRQKHYYRTPFMCTSHHIFAHFLTFLLEIPSITFPTPVFATLTYLLTLYFKTWQNYTMLSLLHHFLS